MKFASLLGLLLALAGCTGGATIRITGAGGRSCYLMEPASSGGSRQRQHSIASWLGVNVSVVYGSKPLVVGCQFASAASVAEGLVDHPEKAVCLCPDN